MSTELKNFIKTSSYIAIPLLVIVIIANLFLPKLFVVAHYITVVFFWGITLGVFWQSNRSMKSEVHGSFVNIFMATSVAKMFIFLAYIILYVFFVKKNNIAFLGFVLINYSIFTVFEILALLKLQKKGKDKTLKKIEDEIEN